MAGEPTSGRAYLGMARREMRSLVGAVEEIEEMLHEDPPDTESVLFLIDHLQGHVSKVRSWTQNYVDKSPTDPKEES